jgi:hypothetical protein
VWLVRPHRWRSHLARRLLQRLAHRRRQQLQRHRSRSGLSVPRQHLQLRLQLRGFLSLLLLLVLSRLLRPRQRSHFLLSALRLLVPRHQPQPLRRSRSLALQQVSPLQLRPLQPLRH